MVSHSSATKFTDFHQRFRGLSHGKNLKKGNKEQTAVVSGLEIRQKKFVSVAALVH